MPSKPGHVGPAAFPGDSSYEREAFAAMHRPQWRIAGAAKGFPSSKKAVMCGYRRNVSLKNGLPDPAGSNVGACADALGPETFQSSVHDSRTIKKPQELN